MYDPVELAHDTSANWVSDQRAVQASQSASTPPIVVTLVHGTFAKDAPWTKDGSILRQQVAAELGRLERNVIFDVFEWSGRNTHKARVKAGYQLADHIRELKKRYPIGKRFIVAHSHGGNVALLAHKHLEPHLHATGIATLGTPFIHAELADNLKGQSLDDLMAQAAPEPDNVSGIVGWIVGIPAAIMYDNWLEATTYSAWYWFVGAAIATGLLAGYLATLIVPYLARAWHRIGGKRAAARLAQAIAFAPIPRTHVLGFVYPGDEAGVLLNVLEKTTALPTLAILWLKRIGWIVFGISMITMFAAVIFSEPLMSAYGLTEDELEEKVGTTFAAIFTTGISIWSTLVIVRYLLSLLRGHPGGFGWERPSIHSHVTITVDPVAAVPAAKSSTFERVPFTAVEDAKRGLRHSGLYEDHRILKALAYWMAHVR